MSCKLVLFQDCIFSFCWSVGYEKNTESSSQMKCLLHFSVTVRCGWCGDAWSGVRVGETWRRLASCSIVWCGTLKRCALEGSDSETGTSSKEGGPKSEEGTMKSRRKEGSLGCRGFGTEVLEASFFVEFHEGQRLHFSDLYFLISLK